MTFVQKLRNRDGERPDTSKEGPHTQLTQNTSPSIWGEFVAKAFSIEEIARGHSTVSMADSMAGLLLDLPKVHGSWSLAVEGRVEPFHIHGVKDTSIHALHCLNEKDPRLRVFSRRMGCLVSGHNGHLCQDMVDTQDGACLKRTLLIPRK